VNVSPLKEPASGQPLLRSLAWGLVIFDLLIVAFAGWTLVTSRAQFVQRAEMATSNLAQVLEQNLLATIQQIDLTLLAVKDEAERPGLGDPGARIEASIQAKLPRIHAIGTLRTANAQGLVDPGNSTQRGFTGRSIADQAYFKQLRDHLENQLVITPPIISPVSGNWEVILARRLNHPEGGFAGIVYATIPLQQIGQLLNQVDVGRWGSISLRGADLGLLARHPDFPGLQNLIGDTRIDGEYLEAVQSGRRVSHFTTHSRFDGEVRSYTFRRTTQPTFFLLVSLSQREFLHSWYQEALLAGMAVFGLITLSLGVAWMARAAWNRQMQAQAERDQLIQQLTQAIAEVKSLEGMLPICGHCKKIRDDQGYWNHLETYISAHTEATFSHGVCPDCAQVLRREMQARREQPDRG
jgi:hypothetical protein